MAAPLATPSPVSNDWVVVEDEKDGGATGCRESKEEGQSGRMSMEAVFEFPSVSIEPSGVKAVLSVIAPPVSSTVARASLRLVAVLDKSGSMRGRKLDLVTKTMLFMLDYFSDQDALGIVIFCTKVTVLAPLTFCTDAGKASLRRALNTIRAEAATNLSGGLLRGIELHSEEQQDLGTPVSNTGSVVRSTFLFTDGQANVGIQELDPLCAAASAGLQELKENRCTISTFGLGEDHDGDLLQSLAVAGNGIYCCIEDEDAIGKAFGQALGGLLTTTHQNVRMEIDCEPVFSVADVFTAFPVSTRTVTEGEASIVRTTVEIGDLFAEERRDVLINFSLPSSPEDIVQTVGQFRIRGFSVLNNGSETSLLPLAPRRVSREQHADPVRRHEQVERHWNRHVATSELKKAKDVANAGNLKAAQTHLKNAIESLEASWLTQQGDIMCCGLLADLKDCLGDMQTEDKFLKVGGKKMNYMGGAHTKQRACIGLKSEQMYSNTQQVAVAANIEQSISIQIQCPVGTEPAQQQPQMLFQKGKKKTLNCGYPRIPAQQAAPQQNIQMPIQIQPAQQAAPQQNIQLPIQIQCPAEEEPAQQ